ncbi:MAG: DUF3179 domain-containing protein [bacterium]|nr:DUF3179 domain-containing protein [bacterium]
MCKSIGIVVAVFALIGAACGGADSAGPDVATTSSPSSPADEDQEPSVAVAEPALGVLPDGPSALETLTAAEFPPALIDPDEIVSGGPPPDGIPPLDEPVFMDVVDALDIFQPEEAVVALEINGEAKAYPVQIMIWHEIANDEVGGVPVSVTYCPLCNSAVTYRREIRGVETTFGTSGRLFASALVMYDRATETMWTHFDGRAVVGLLAGEQLEAIASPLLSWKEFMESYPTGQVLDPEATGFGRSYGRNPYFGYDDEGTEPFLFTGITDPRAASKERVVGVELDGTSVAFTLDAISDGQAQATTYELAGTDIVVLWRSGQSTALEAESISEGRDVGSVGVFLPVVDGRALTLIANGDTFRDEETGSVWNATGEAIEGELAGTRLERVVHLDTFWFAWATYRPGSDLVEGT